MPEHSHPHSHFGAGGSRAASRLAFSLGLTAVFVVIEIAAGILGNSLALLTDAFHNLTDVFALGLSWHAARLALRPANSNKTFGYHRAGILAALANSTTLVVISVYIFYEAYQRFLAPPEVNSGILVGVGLVAFAINLITAWLIKPESEHDLNMRSAFVHLMGDVLSTVGAVIAGVVIYFTNWNWLDPLVSVLIGFLILWNTWGILRETVEILLEATPQDVDLDHMVTEMKQLKGVLGVHDLHVWSLTQGLRSMSAHILTEDISISAGKSIQAEINELMARRYRITHATLQLECVGCHPDLYCDLGKDTNEHD
jgi:cobalt-zinc-cadmium efflux system protein